MFVSDDTFQRKCLFNGEIMFYSAFKKDTEKFVLLNWSERLDKNYWEVQGWENFKYVSITKTTFWRAWNIDYENNCAHLKMKGSFQLYNLVHDFWKKKYHRVHVSSPWCMHAPKFSTRHTASPLNYLSAL